MKSSTTKTKKKKSASSDTQKSKKSTKDSRKGDGSFPDLLVVAKSGERKLYTSTAPDGPFIGHDAESMDGLSQDGQEVAVYKLRRVSTLAITRKVVR